MFTPFVQYTKQASILSDLCSTQYDYFFSLFVSWSINTSRLDVYMTCCTYFSSSDVKLKLKILDIILCGVWRNSATSHPSDTNMHYIHTPVYCMTIGRKPFALHNTYNDTIVCMHHNRFVWLYLNAHFSYVSHNYIQYNSRRSQTTELFCFLRLLRRWSRSFVDEFITHSHMSPTS